MIASLKYSSLCMGLTLLISLTTSCGSTTAPLDKTTISDTAFSTTANADSVITDYQAAGARLLDEEQIGEMKIGQPFKGSLEGWAKTPKILWGGDGLIHQSYSNESAGIELNLSSVDSAFTKAVISSITLDSTASLSTKRGIRIGSAYKEVVQAYGKLINPDESNESAVVLGSIYGGIIFELKDGKVNRIFLGAAGE